MSDSIAHDPSGMITLRFEGLLALQVALDATADVVQVAKERGLLQGTH